MPSHPSAVPTWMAAACLSAGAGVAQVDAPAGVTFSRDVAPIIYSRCAMCHHPGESAPFSLLTFDDVRKRAGQIRDVTQSGFMPPWMPAPGQGRFLGERRLTERERDLIARWVDAGAPEGDPAGAPAPPAFTQGWQLGPPDLVLESPEYHLAADGADVFRNFVVPTALDAPKWIEAVELRPTNPRVTHHARLGVDASNESPRRDAEDPEPGYDGMAWGQDPDGQLVIWAPGMTAARGEPGVAWQLFPRSCLVLHAHLQPSGKPESARFRIGIHFAKAPPTQRPVMMRVGSCDIDIPAGAPRHVVTDQYTLPVDADVHTIFPHAHSLCTELHVVAEKPDGTREPLISIDRFDENWHDLYRCATPVRLPRGTRISSTFAYDNTDANPRNRSRPARRVGYGSNVTDEMADVYLQVTPARADQREVLLEDYRRYDLRAQIIGARKSLELDPANTWSQEALAAYYVGSGEPARAIPILENRIRSGPPAVFPVVSLGMAQLAAGDSAGAQAQFRRATAMDPGYPLAWLGLGRALAAANQPDPAQDALRQAIELAPGLFDAHLALADLLVKAGKPRDAEEVCKSALEGAPENASVYLKLAEIAAGQRQYDASLAYCVKAQAAAPYTHPPKVLLAVFCEANADHERAALLLAQARAEAPRHPVPPLIQGQLAVRSRQWSQALPCLDAAASLPMPDTWPESHQRRFQILLQTQRCLLAQAIQDAAMARDALSRWMKLEPDKPELRRMYESVGGK